MVALEQVVDAFSPLRDYLRNPPPLLPTEPPEDPPVVVEYPRVKFAGVMAKVEADCRRKLLGGLAELFKGANQDRRLTGLTRLDNETNALSAVLAHYLAVRSGEATQLELEEALERSASSYVPRHLRSAATLARRAKRPAVMLPGLAEAVSGTIYFRSSQVVDAAEDALVRQFVLPWGTLPGETAAEERSYVLWRMAIRLSLATAFVRSIAYDEVWGPVANPEPGRKILLSMGIYGTGGYWLSKLVPRLAVELSLHETFDALRAALRVPETAWLGEYVALGDDRRAASYDVAMKLLSLPREAQAWRNQHLERERDVAKRGQLFPFRFPTIPGDLWNRSSKAARPPSPPEDEKEDKLPQGPDQMHARPQATERIKLAIELWEQYVGRAEFKPDLLAHVITAGSLRNGGAHPPHKTHRNGAMFDTTIGIGHAKAQRGFTMADAVEIAGNEGVVTELLMEEMLNKELFPLNEPPEEIGDNQRFAGVLLGKPRPVFRYPKSEVKTNLVGVAVPCQELGTRYTQCLLLTFPSQILFASWEMLSEAKRSLIARIQDCLEVAQDEDPGSDDEKVLRYILDRLGPPPSEDFPPNGHDRELFPLADHYNHWHVSYDAAEVEREKDEAKNRAVEWIRAKGSILVWSSVLADQVLRDPYESP